MSEVFITVVVIKDNVIDEIDLFKSSTANACRDEAEAFFCKKVKSIFRDADVERALEDGYFAFDNGSVCISWPDNRKDHQV